MPKDWLMNPWATSVEIIIKHFEVAAHEKVVLFSQMRGDLETDFEMMVDGGTITKGLSKPPAVIFSFLRP